MAAEPKQPQKEQTGRGNTITNSRLTKSKLKGKTPLLFSPIATKTRSRSLPNAKASFTKSSPKNGSPASVTSSKHSDFVYYTGNSPAKQDRTKALAKRSAVAVVDIKKILIPLQKKTSRVVIKKDVGSSVAKYLAKKQSVRLNTVKNAKTKTKPVRTGAKTKTLLSDTKSKLAVNKKIGQKVHEATRIRIKKCPNSPQKKAEISKKVPNVQTKDKISQGADKLVKTETSSVPEGNKQSKAAKSKQDKAVQGNAKLKSQNKVKKETKESSQGTKPQDNSNKEKKKRKRDSVSDDDDDDDNVRYAFAEGFDPDTCLKPKKRKSDSPNGSVANSRTATLSPHKSPRKLLLKDSVRPKGTPGVSSPKSKQFLPLASPPNGPKPASPATAINAAAVIPSAESVSPPQPLSPCAFYSRCQASPGSKLEWSSNTTVPVLPVIPTSPPLTSLSSQLKELPNKLQANRAIRRKRTASGSSMDEEILERRSSVRQSERVFKYKEIIVKKCQAYTQIWLFTNTKLKNALSPKVLEELTQALHNAKFDDSRLVMLCGHGSVFCSGIDLHFLLSDDRHKAAKTMADSLRAFIDVLLAYPKPIVAVVNGPAVGAGVAILPLCDVVYASDKATFHMPYTSLAQTPEGCSSYLFPHALGMAMANELLLGGRKMTAIEASQVGLVSQVFWPTSMMQEVIPRLENIAKHSARALEASKILIRSHQRQKLEITNRNECQWLQEQWATSECQRAIKAYLDKELDL